MRGVTTAVVCLALAVAVSGYLPGMSPRDYSKDELVDLKVNKLTSVKTQLPYDFYDGLPFCRPAKIVDKKENLGEILRGDRIANSLYKLSVLTNVDCAVLGGDIAPWHKGEPQPADCTHAYNKKELEKFTVFVKNEYRVHWELDNLPSAQVKNPQAAAKDQEYVTGYMLGHRDSRGHVMLNNHASIKVKYHKDLSYGEKGQMGYRITGFEVAPESHDYENPAYAPNTCKGPELVIPAGTQSKKIAWTYSVVWEEDPNTLWAQRWNRYFTAVDTQIHWFSIINSVMIVLFLTGMVAMIMMRTLHADLRQYTAQLESQEEVEETGWKLVHGDVFRAPRFPMLLSSLVGFGSQVFVMVIITLLFAVMGFMSPANRGGLLTAVLLLVTFSGVFAGYTSTGLYKFFKGVHWKKSTVMTAFLIPGIMFAIFMFLDFFIMGMRSSGSVPFTTLLMIMALWFCISLPLVFFGSFVSFKRQTLQAPVGTNQIPRQIPDQVWYMHPVISILMGGILPFGAVFIELYFILSALWGQQMFYLFGFLFIVFVILLITCAEISIVMTYFQLCSEDYHWWWRAFLTSGASALYLFLYSAFYFATKLEITKFVSGLLYFGYTAIFTLVFFCLTGFIGFSATFYFIRKIYAAVPFE
jgi:transmembrane 9 superfamily protein 2/4